MAEVSKTANGYHLCDKLALKSIGAKDVYYIVAR